MISFDKQTEIPVMEQFYTVQGEGQYQGAPAYFIRLAGCDVGCHWCDVKESWTASPEQVKPIQTVIEDLHTLPKGICVITGGEPAMYDLDPLTRAIHKAGWRTHIETSGSWPMTGSWDWICLSPKKFKPALEDWLQAADELKVIVYHKDDLNWALKYSGLVSEKCLKFIQPEWSREKLVLPLIVDFVKSNTTWRISLQIHKYLGID